MNTWEAKAAVVYLPCWCVTYVSIGRRVLFHKYLFTSKFCVCTETTMKMYTVYLLIIHSQTHLWRLHLSSYVAFVFFFHLVSFAALLA